MLLGLATAALSYEYPSIPSISLTRRCW